MKTKIAILAILLMPVTVFACPIGQHADSGACAYDTSAPAEEAAKWVSDEKPPTNKMPSYQREGIKVIDAPRGVEQSNDVAHDLIAEGKQR